MVVVIPRQAYSGLYGQVVLLLYVGGLLDRFHYISHHKMIGLERMSDCRDV